MFLHLPVYLDKVDGAPFPLRPVDELRMEEISAAGIGKHDYYSGGVIVAKKIKAEDGTKR